MSRYLLGIDIGSYESKGVLTDAAGRVIATQVCKHEMSFPAPGLVEHDAEAIWWGEFKALARGLLAASGIDPAAIAGIGVSAVFSMLPVDEAFRPLRPGGILYGIDTRSVAEIAAIKQRLGEDTIIARTGNPLNAQSVGPKIQWLRNHEPEVYRRARSFVPAASFIVGRLTGALVIDHLEAVFFSPLYDLATQDWAHDLCAGIVEVERLPPVRWACEIAGRVTAAAAAETGLAEGTPVTVGTSDVATEALSIGVTQPGELMLMYGSTAWLTLITDAPLKHRDLWASPFVFPGTFCLHGGMATSGSLTRWFRDQLGQDLLAAEQAGGEEAYAALTRLAAAVPPGAEGLVVLPYFAGERTPLNDPAARGVIFGLTLTHGRGHLYRAAYEGVAYSIAHALEVMRDAGAAPRRAIAVGGGVKNPDWLQAVSDVARLPQEVPALTFGASYGNAFLAGHASGLIQSLDAIRDWVSIARRVEPDPANFAVYDRRLATYRELYRRNADLMHDVG